MASLGHDHDVELGRIVLVAARALDDEIEGIARVDGKVRWNVPVRFAGRMQVLLGA